LEIKPSTEFARQGMAGEFQIQPMDSCTWSTRELTFETARNHTFQDIPL
jgi:hypothetical protein